MHARTLTCAAAVLSIAALLTLAAPAVATPTTLFDYGVVTMGPVSLSGNARILGGTRIDPVSIYSELVGDAQAVQFSGNSRLAGDVYSVNPTDSVTLWGNSSIGGVRGRRSTLADAHVHQGQDALPLPSLNVAAFDGLAGNVIDSGSSTKGNLTLQNIRIAAGTNPVFSGNVKLLGLVLIESPNVVTFRGNVNLTGMIVGENSVGGADDAITVVGNFTSRGVESLPDQPQFSQLRTMGGSMLIAPSFDVSFNGNTRVNNGTIAAESLRVAGNTRMMVKGSVLIYGNSPLNLGGNTYLQIVHTPGAGVPPGLGSPVPEPVSLLTMLGGLGLLAMRRRRR